MLTLQHSAASEVLGLLRKEGGPYSKGAARPSSYILEEALKAYIILDPEATVVRPVENKDGKGSIHSVDGI